MSSTLESLVSLARSRGASDLHLESNMAPVLRVRGALQYSESVLSSSELMRMARSLLGENNWGAFIEQKSFDLSMTISGVRCRINVLKTARGIGMAIRLLATFKATIEKLNLHPDLRNILSHNHGLVLVSGPTGSGKSSTMAALIEEINATSSRHIITIENPIEYHFKSQKSLVRQREVGRDTPSFNQALIDCLREDPDVIMVGEMREAETMQLTLNAAETGHLVFATVHSSNVAEAIQRVVSAFPSEIQESVRSQLADSLVAVISQRLRYKPDLKIRVPECEIMFTNSPVRALIREGKYFKMRDILQTGAAENMWTFSRYVSWLETKQNWYVPSEREVYETEDEVSTSLPSLPRTSPTQSYQKPSQGSRPSPSKPNASIKPKEEKHHHDSDHDILEIHDDDDDDLDHIVKGLK